MLKIIKLSLLTLYKLYIRLVKFCICQKRASEICCCYLITTSSSLCKSQVWVQHWRSVTKTSGRLHQRLRTVTSTAKVTSSAMEIAAITGGLIATLAILVVSEDEKVYASTRAQRAITRVSYLIVHYPTRLKLDLFCPMVMVHLGCQLGRGAVKELPYFCLPFSLQFLDKWIYFGGISPHFLKHEN